jgi:hypothetical protein
MRNTILIFLLGGIICFDGCKTTKSSIGVVGSWVNKQKISDTPRTSVFIIVLTENLNTRTTLEMDLANAAKANGIKAVQSLAVFGPVVTTKDPAVFAALMRKIKEKECETILTVALVDAKSETKYNPATSINYDPLMYYGGYYSSFSGYYAYSINNFYSPGYYSTKSTYYLETNLYDANDGGILFSVQTKALNPPQIEQASKKFTETLIDELKRNDLLRKRS